MASFNHLRNEVDIQWNKSWTDGEAISTEITWSMLKPHFCAPCYFLSYEYTRCKSQQKKRLDMLQCSGLCVISAHVNVVLFLLHNSLSKGHTRIWFSILTKSAPPPPLTMRRITITQTFKIHQLICTHDWSSKSLHIIRKKRMEYDLSQLLQ